MKLAIAVICLTSIIMIYAETVHVQLPNEAWIEKCKARCMEEGGNTAQSCQQRCFSTAPLMPDLN